MKTGSAEFKHQLPLPLFAFVDRWKVPYNRSKIILLGDIVPKEHTNALVPWLVPGILVELSSASSAVWLLSLHHRVSSSHNPPKKSL